MPVLAYLLQPVIGGPPVPGGAPMHALCWLLLGLLHAWVARLRRSPNQGLLAALFINFAVWVLLGTHEDLAFLTHPQLWLIPLGLILLAAEFINQPHLAPGLSAALRSLGLLCIYASSTFDMLLTGLGNSVALPVFLAVLSVLGVLLGILLRLRAPLFFGTAFLGVVIFAQIWHAAVDQQQAWVWWASGIVLGLTILALFASFEKHRNEVLRMLDEVRRWHDPRCPLALPRDAYIAKRDRPVVALQHQRASWHFGAERAAGGALGHLDLVVNDLAVKCDFQEPPDTEGDSPPALPYRRLT